MLKSSLLIINKNFLPKRSASGRLAYDLAQYMASKGWDVSVLCATNNAKQDNNFSVYSVKRPKKPDSFFGNLLISLRFIIMSFKLKPHQYVITMTDPAYIIFLKSFFIKRKTQKHIHWVQDLYPDLEEKLNEKDLPKLRKKMLQYLKQANKIVVTGRDVATKIRQKNILPDKIAYIPNWTILHGTHLKQQSEDMSIPEISHNLKKDDSPKFRVIYAGNLGKAHPVGVVIKAAEILRDHEEIEFVFVGDKHANSRLSIERDKRELENIRFIPYQPTAHFQNVLESADLHLVTLRPKAEGLIVPCKFYASLAVGRPTVFLGPNSSEIGQVIKEYGCGDIVEDMRAESMAKAILSYRNDGEKWFAAQEGALKASENFYPEKSLREWAHLLGAL